MSTKSKRPTKAEIEAELANFPGGPRLDDVGKGKDLPVQVKKKRKGRAGQKPRARGQPITAGTYMDGELADWYDDMAEKYGTTPHELRKMALEHFRADIEVGSIIIAEITETVSTVGITRPKTE